MKTHRGTIAMWKISLILVAGLFCLLYAIAAPASKAYWENVGFEMDKTLNPLKYKTGEGK
jgi:hypothetical protein